MPPPGDAHLLATIELLQRVKEGDRQALESLVARYLPRLTRWASGRLPRWARDLSDTDDMVQDTLMRSLRGLGGFEMRGEGALQAYLRQAVANRVRDELRRRMRRPDHGTLPAELPALEPGPLEATIGATTLARYERALQVLDAEAREAIVARVEMGCSFAEIAEMFGKPSSDAARMMVSRSLLRLAEVMRDGA
ncbi:MAG: RNA polymerase sigma factor [Vicinamibacterales bacterium]